MADKDLEGGHFKGRDAMQHIVEVKAEGILASSETHGAETPGFIFAAADSARDTSVALLLLILLLGYFEFEPDQIFAVLIAFCSGWVFWKLGRSAWLSWSRLERLHRVMNEERLEIENNRDQERIELMALYQAKGFQGKLLEDVVHVLMADGDRLLRVMLQEEMGFRLEENEHPLIQGLGASCGVLFSTAFSIAGYLLYAQPGVLVFSLVALLIASLLSALYERNKVIPALCWNLGLAIFAYAVAKYGMQFITS
jgi:vacuolar iron transporter family protein